MPTNYSAAACGEDIFFRVDDRDSAASVSAMRRRIIVATGKISLMPPAVWPAQRIHSCWRPAWVVETIWPRNRSRSRHASSRFALHSVKKAVGRDRGIVGKPFVPGIGLMSLSTSTLMTSSDWAAVIASFHSFGAGASIEAIKRVPEIDAGCAEHERRRDATTVEDATGRNDRDR